MRRAGFDLVWRFLWHGRLGSIQLRPPEFFPFSTPNPVRTRPSPPVTHHHPPHPPPTHTHSSLQFLKAFQITDAATWLAANTAVVKQLLEYHTLPQTVTLDDMTDGESLTTDLADETITVSRLQVLQKEAPYFGYNIQLVSTGGLLPVAQITKGDIETTDDVLVQIIDHILIPASILA